MKRHEILLFTLVFVSYGYFHQGGDWNQNSRMALTRALVERRTVCIDGFQGATKDLSFYDGHYYSDKVPGSSMLAVPGYFLGRKLAAQLGRARGPHWQWLLATRIAILLSASLASALLVVALFRFALLLCHDVRAATMTSLLYALGTMAFPYSTALYGHQICAASLFLSFFLLFRVGEGTYRDRRAAWALFVSGLAAGWSVFAEYPAAPAVLLLTIYCYVVVKKKRQLAYFLAGGLVILLLLMWYNNRCFGNPFKPGLYELEDVHDRHGAPDLPHYFHVLVIPPRPFIFYEYTFLPRLGLFVVAPFLLLCLPGLWEFFRGGRYRRELYLFLGLIAYYFVFFCSWVRWDSGWTYGARHLLPMLPFLCVGLAFVLPQTRKASPLTALSCAAALAVYVWLIKSSHEIWREYRPVSLWDAVLVAALVTVLIASVVRARRWMPITALGIGLATVVVLAAGLGPKAVAVYSGLAAALFLFVPLAFVLSRYRWFQLPLMASSLVFALAATSVQPVMPSRFQNPLWEFVLPKFLAGEVAALPTGLDESESYDDYVREEAAQAEWNSFNVGELFGLRGLWSLSPLLLVWVGLGGGLLASRTGIPRPRDP